MSKHRHKDKHHIIPRSRGGANENPNIKTVDKKWHQNLHSLFINAVTHEKIGKILEWDEAVIDPYWRNLMEELLGVAPEDKYIRESFKKGAVHILGENRSK